MTCEEVVDRLDEFVDGGLTGAELHEVELHLAACGACKQEADDLTSLVARTGRLPRELAPSRDLWPGVAQGVERRGMVRRGRFGRASLWSGLAAAAAVVASVAWWRANDRVPASPVVPGVGTVQLTSLDADRDFERAASDMLMALDARRGGLTPEARARVDESLRVIAEALAAIRLELEKDPGNPDLNHLLVSVHQRRIEVLRTLMRVTA